LAASRSGRYRIGVACYSSFGGSGVVATDLGRRLAQAGHEIHFITDSVPARLRGFTENVYFHEVQGDTYPLFTQSQYPLALATKMTEVAETHGLDLLHVHYAVPHAVAAYLAKQIMRPRKLPVITTLHGTDITLVGQMPSYHRVTRFSIGHSDVVTAVSRWLADETRRVFKTRRKIHVVPNFVDPEVFAPRRNPSLRRSLAPKGELLVMHASNMRPVKRVETVVRIFEGVRRCAPARLLMVGEGPERAVAERLAHERGLSRDVRFMGSQELIEHLLPLADLFLLPSEQESFGLVALEAMSAGVPVVSTDRGGTPEVIRNGIDGFLHDPDDLPGMISSACALLTTPSLKRRIIASAKERARQQFHPDDVTDQYLALYRSLLNGGGRRSASPGRTASRKRPTGKRRSPPP
jgi:N-acetyl-alpha-D-glucosaminyl L-malate synthase BshA